MRTLPSTCSDHQSGPILTSDGLVSGNSYLDKTLHQDRLCLTVVQGILETVADEDDERHAVAQLVRTSGRSGGIVAAELVQEPVARRGKTLLVLLRCGTQSEKSISWCFCTQFTHVLYPS